MQKHGGTSNSVWRETNNATGFVLSYSTYAKLKNADPPAGPEGRSVELGQSEIAKQHEEAFGAGGQVPLSMEGRLLRADRDLPLWMSVLG